jgi:CrcB protein
MKFPVTGALRLVDASHDSAPPAPGVIDRTGSAMNLVSFLSVGFGAFAGAILRWLLGLALNPVFPTLPIGTLAANLLGGLIIGGAMGMFAHYETLSIAWRLAIVTGFLGGLTTFSTFSAETVSLLLRQQYAWAAAIITAHLAGSLLMTLAGIALVRSLLRT